MAARRMQAARLSSDKAARVLVAAQRVFLREGYRASMDRIAAEAGVAKQTVYSHFRSKERLFAETVRIIANAIVVSLGEPDLELREALLRFGAALRKRTMSPEGVGLHRALVAEAPRFPRLARLVYATGWETALEALAAFLERHMKAGRMRRDDPSFAAQMLMSMLVGHERVRLLYGIQTARNAGHETRRCRQIVDLFLAAFRTDRQDRPAD